MAAVKNTFCVGVVLGAAFTVGVVPVAYADGVRVPLDLVRVDVVVGGVSEGHFGSRLRDLDGKDVLEMSCIPNCEEDFLSGGVDTSLM